MPKRGSKQPYKPKKEYTYTIGDIAELAGITRNALNVAKVHGKIDPEDFGSVVSFLTRRIIQNRLGGDLFEATSQTKSKAKRKPKRTAVKPRKLKKVTRRK